MDRYLVSIECQTLRSDVHLVLISRGYTVISETVLQEEGIEYLLVIEGVRVRNELISYLLAKGYTVICQTVIPVKDYECEANEHSVCD